MRSDPNAATLAEALYATIFNRIVPVSSPSAAEMTKLLENIYRCVNIALINELKLLSLRMNIDIWEVIAAAATKPFGFQPFYPGPGLGGHCIPIDPFYLSWKAREFDFHTRFIELAGEINASMPYHVVDAIAEALNQHKKALNGAHVLILGVAYKKRRRRSVRVAFANHHRPAAEGVGRGELQRPLFSIRRSWPEVRPAD